MPISARQPSAWDWVLDDIIRQPNQRVVVNSFRQHGRSSVFSDIVRALYGAQVVQQEEEPCSSQSASLWWLEPCGVPVTLVGDPVPIQVQANVAGITFADDYPGFCDVLMAVHEEPSRWDEPVENIMVQIIPEPENEHDANAMRVFCPMLDQDIGHLPRQYAAWLKTKLDEGQQIITAYISGVYFNPAHEDRPRVTVTYYVGD